MKMKPVKTMALLGLLLAAPLALGALAQEADLSQYGPDPKLPPPYRGLLPTMKIAGPQHGTTADRGLRRATP